MHFICPVGLGCVPAELDVCWRHRGVFLGGPLLLPRISPVKMWWFCRQILFKGNDTIKGVFVQYLITWPNSILVSLHWHEGVDSVVGLALLHWRVGRGLSTGAGWEGIGRRRRRSREAVLIRVPRKHPSCPGLTVFETIKLFEWLWLHSQTFSERENEPSRRETLKSLRRRWCWCPNWRKVHIQRLVAVEGWFAP